MKSVESFWSSVQRYNEGTLAFQLFFVLAIFSCLYVTYKYKIQWIPKVLIAALNVYIAVVFFLLYDRSPMGLYFALPLFLLIGVSCIIDAIKNKDDCFRQFSTRTLFGICLISIYPMISLLLGHVFPNQVLYVLPCPVICISILLYSRYDKKSLLTLLLMTIWALTGIKALVFDVYEDLILFIFSFYSIYLIVQRKRHPATALTA